MNALRRFTSNSDMKLLRALDAAGKETVKIAGYAAVFYDGTEGTEYRLMPDYIERLVPGCFDDVLKTEDVICAFNHDDSKILGRTSAGTLRLGVDARGLHYENDPADTSYGRDLIVSMDRKDVKGSSFSFWAAEDRVTRLDDGTYIVEIIKVKRLFDVGPVTFPAYDATEAELRSLKQRAETSLPRPSNTPEQTRRALNGLLAAEL